MLLALHYNIIYCINYIIYSFQLIFQIELLWLNSPHCLSSRYSWETCCCHLTEKWISQQVFCLTTLPFFIWAGYSLLMELLCRCGTLHAQNKLCSQILGYRWVWNRRGRAVGRHSSRTGLTVLNEPVRWKAKYSPTPSLNSPWLW